MAVTVSDAGPLIHLDEIDGLDLLEGFSPLLIPATVWGEAHRHRPSCSLALVAEAQVVADPAIDDPVQLALFKAFDLDAGERAAIALLQVRSGRLLLCDDSAPRLAAESLGCVVRGTIGLIVRAVRRGTRSLAEVRQLLGSLPERSTLHVSGALLQRVLAQPPEA
ncbi:MAG: hypothetical protein QOE70_1486 [Chthoniobacter sp.]|jgi:predicted nucleic acid-binding protein|nr:hypothetical protein [Chthoniobacter sp.]